MYTCAGVSIKSLHMYDLVLCIHLGMYQCAANTLHVTITVGRLLMLFIIQCAYTMPVWFYAWSERQMFIPQGVYSHMNAHTPGYTLLLHIYIRTYL